MSITAAVVVALLALFVIITVVKAIVSVPEGGAAVIERLTGMHSRAGRRFHTVLGPGRHFLVPVRDRVRAIVDLGEQVLSFPPQLVPATDGEVAVEFQFAFTVEDPRAYTEITGHPAIAIEHLVFTTLRAEIAPMSAERAITTPEELHRTVWTVLHDTTPKWGIKAGELTLTVSPPAAPETPSTAQEWY